MKSNYLSKSEMTAMDKLKDSYGGAKAISQAIKEKSQYDHRRKSVADNSYGQLLNEAEGFAKKFPKAEKYIKKNNIKFTKPGVSTTQVSAWQGSKVIHNCMKRLAENGNVLIPLEQITVMALSDDYIYNGDLMAALGMTENIMGARFCVSNLLGTPLPPKRFENIRKVTGVKIDTVDAGDGLHSLVLKNMGTFFGNFCGVEVGNDNHLVYVDTITRAALETGANFFLNPSWSTIVAACYYGRDIKNMSFKVSMFLSVQNTIQFRMLLNIIREFLREDGTSAVREINIGNAISPEKFVECGEILKEYKIKGISLAAHIRINTDLGDKDFRWFDNAVKVLSCGCDMTIKYESNGECHPEDTIASYFLPKNEREEKVEVLGEVLYNKVVRCDQDAKEIMKLGHKVEFAKISAQ
ncbi:MAG: hypothetical protein KAS70_05460 [Planctomycetes bacterium]|nr:hypothetical protein [Planctomycetota bacterium]